MTRFLRHNRHTRACAVRAVINAHIWQRQGYSLHTRVGLYERLAHEWRIREKDGGATVPGINKVCAEFGWPNVWGYPSLSTLLRTLDFGDAAVITARKRANNDGHAMFIYRQTPTRLYGTGLYLFGDYMTKRVFDRRWRITSIVRVPAVTRMRLAA